MTNRQRQLIVLSAGIVLLLGPIVIMGNCSGFNEGSMKVAACTVDFPLARALADLLWGIVLLSAFLIGLPILAYVAACLVLLKLLASGLRKASEAAAHPSKPGSQMLTLAAAAPMVVVVAAFLLQIGAELTGSTAASSAFDERCKTAGEQLPVIPVGPVQSLYYEQNAGLVTYDVKDGEFGSVSENLESEIKRMIGRGWIRTAETSELDPRTNAPTGKKIRHELYVPYAGRVVDQFSSQYGVFTKDLAGGTGDKSGIKGTEIAVKDLKSGAEIATLRYFALPARSRICGANVEGRTDVEAFLVKALKLTRQPPQALPGGANTPVLAIPAGQAYDCQLRKYRALSSWAWPQPFFGGENLRLPDPAREWTAPAPGTVGDLLVNTVCNA